MPCPFLKSKEQGQEERGLGIPGSHRQQGPLDLMMFCSSYVCFYGKHLCLAQIMVSSPWQ